MKPRLILSAILITLMGSIQAQISFVEETGTSFIPVFESAIAFSDIDGDHDNDVLITGRNAGSVHVSRLYKNDGTGSFTEVSPNPITGVSFSSVAFADVDGDNDPDLMITGKASSSPLLIVSRMYLNDGSGGFSQKTGTPFDAVYHSSIAFADVDGDSDQDLLITGDNWSGDYIAKLYINDGAGNFSLKTGTPFPGVRYSSVAFADVDGDADQDLLITGITFAPTSTDIAKLYINDGAGNFSEVSGTPFTGVSSSSVAFSDIDGDEDMDVLITGTGSSSGKTAKMYLNDGNGVFSEAPGMPFFAVDNSSVAFVDVEGDGDSDLLITGDAAISGKVAQLYVNDGQGNFSALSGMPFDGVGSSSVAFEDVDGDFDPDLILTGENAGGSYISKLYRNQTFIPCEAKDGYEPNNLMANATNLYSGTMLGTGNMAICPRLDEDWFYFTVNDPGMDIRINLKSLPANFQLALHNSAGLLAESTKPGTLDEAIVYSNATPGTYFIRVWGHEGAFNPTQGYTLSVILTKPTPLNVTSVKSPLSGLPFRESGQKAKLEAFPNPAVGQLEIAFSFSEAGSASLTLINSIGQPLWRRDGFLAGNNRVEIELSGFGQGLYYLELVHPLGREQLPLMILGR